MGLYNAVMEYVPNVLETALVSSSKPLKDDLLRIVDGGRFSFTPKIMVTALYASLVLGLLTGCGVAASQIEEPVTETWTTSCALPFPGFVEDAYELDEGAVQREFYYGVHVYPDENCKVRIERDSQGEIVEIVLYHPDNPDFNAFIPTPMPEKVDITPLSEVKDVYFSGTVRYSGQPNMTWWDLYFGNSCLSKAIQDRYEEKGGVDSFFADLATLNNLNPSDPMLVVGDEYDLPARIPIGAEFECEVPGLQ